MKRNPDSERLLDALLGEVAPEDFRAALLDRTLRHARFRRGIRGSARVFAATAVVGVLAVWLRIPSDPPGLVVRSPDSNTPAAGVIHTRALEPAFVVATQPSLTRVINTESPAIDIVQTDPNLQLYHEINDDQLLLLFAGGSTALTRSGDGEVQLLFLDKATGSGPPMH